MFSLAPILGPRLPIINILDIGAMIEGIPRYAPIYNSSNTSLTLVEPDKKQSNQLKKIYGDKVRLLDCYLGDGNPATIHLTYYPGCSSIYEPDDQIINQFSAIGTEPKSNFEVIEKKQISTKRLDDISPSVSADFFKIDVQGAELQIMENAINLLGEVSVIETEAEFIPIYKDQPLFGDLQIFLRAKGFILHKLIDVGSRCFRPMKFGHKLTAGMSQMLWADAIFIKDFTHWEDYTNEGLLKTAYIMHEIYGSYDLVHRLLSEYDKRENTAFTYFYGKALIGDQPLSRFILNFKEEF
jgi:FkbM family methyltransferase